MKIALIARRINLISVCSLLIGLLGAFVLYRLSTPIRDFYFGEDRRMAYIAENGKPYLPPWRCSSFQAAAAPQIRLDGKTYKTPSAKRKSLYNEASKGLYLKDGASFIIDNAGLESLPDGRIFICGAMTSGARETSKMVRPLTFIFDPKTLKNVEGPEMPYEVFDPTLTLLKDKRILISGGFQKFEGEPIDTIAIYDPALCTIEKIGVMCTPRARHASIQIDDSHVLSVAGESGRMTLGSLTKPCGDIEVFNLKTAKSQLAGSVSPRENPIVFNDGPAAVLVIGGWYETTIMHDTRWVYGCDRVRISKAALQ